MMHLLFELSIFLKDPGPVFIKLAETKFCLKSEVLDLKSETVFGLKLVSYSQNS